MSETVVIEAGGVEFLAQVQPQDRGVAPVGGDRTIYDLADFGDSLKAICGELGRVWEAVRPSEATVELSLGMSVKTGKLTALLVEGGGEANVKVTLTWKPQPTA